MIQDQEIVRHNTLSSLSSTLQTDAADQTSPGSASSRTTMGRTVLIGSAGDGGYRQLTAGPGEPHIVRSDIIGATFTTLTYALTAFAQMTDLHIVDDQSPLRVEFLDRYANAGPSHYASYPTSAAYRAHESLSTQVVDAMCQLCDNECVTRTGAFFDRSDQRNVKSDRAAAHREAINAY